MPKAKAKTEATATAKKARKANDLLNTLNPAQKNAVEFGEGPLLIIAGAGTGKTAVITRRIAHLIEQGVKPDEILALTFTDKAATEMEERVDKILPYGYYDLWISTFHSFCERILKQHALDIGISNDFDLYDQTKQWLLVRKNLEMFDLDYYQPLGSPSKFIGAMIKHFGKAKDEEISPEMYLEFARNLKLDTSNPEFDTEEEVKRVQEIAKAYHIYQKLLLDNNALDFGDLINHTLKLLRARPKILHYYQNKFKYILVDEFQDTNYAQYELVKLLAAPKNNLNVVGDDDQSIYKFRGASVSNIMQFKKEYPKAREITLTENYRSVQNILDLAYQFIQQNNPDRLEARLNIDKKLDAANKGKGQIAVLAGLTQGDEVDLVINKITELKNKDSKISWNDFAILTRANNHANAFISKLSEAGLPYTFFANKGLYKKEIIADLVTYMKLLVDFHDSAALYRVLTLEPYTLAHADLVAITYYADKHTLSIYEALQQAALIPELSKETQKIIAAVLGNLQKHGQLITEKNVAECFVDIVRDLGVWKRIDEDTFENIENRELIEQFYRKIVVFESENTDKSTRAFLEYLSYEDEAGEEGKIDFDPNQGPESIKVLTIHSSKGLEFKYVFIANMIDGRFPSRQRGDAIEIPQPLIKEQLPEGDAHLQEERRLFYVAMTRAKQGLYFSYAADYGGKRVSKPSQFLVDIGLVAKPQKGVELVARQKALISAKPDANLFLPTVFSYSQLSDFERCPLAYKYKYVYHLPVRGNQHLSFGNTIHFTFQKFLNEYKNNLESKQLDLFESPAKEVKLPEFEKLAELYKKCWIDEWYPDKPEKAKYREIGAKMLRAFYDDLAERKPVPKFIEQGFRLKLDEFDFKGKIDRADLLPDGSVMILDYKTGAKDKLDEEQLMIYQWAMQEQFQQKVSQAKYWFLQKNIFSEPHFATDQQIEKMKNNLLETIHKIRDAVANDSFKELHSHAPTHKCEFEELE